MKVESGARAGMTVDELREFADQVEKMGIPGRTRVRSRTSFGGKLLRISADADHAKLDTDPVAEPPR